jgi:hypothetical protein
MPGARTGKDATMLKHFSPPIVVPFAIIIFVLVTAYVRMH